MTLVVLGVPEGLAPAARAWPVAVVVEELDELPGDVGGAVTVTVRVAVTVLVAVTVTTEGHAEAMLGIVEGSPAGRHCTTNASKFASIESSVCWSAAADLAASWTVATGAAEPGGGVTDPDGDPGTPDEGAPLGGLTEPEGWPAGADAEPPDEGFVDPDGTAGTLADGLAESAPEGAAAEPREGAAGPPAPAEVGRAAPAAAGAFVVLVVVLVAAEAASYAVWSVSSLATALRQAASASKTAFCSGPLSMVARGWPAATVSPALAATETTIPPVGKLALTWDT